LSQPTYSERALAYCHRVVDKKHVSSKWTKAACQRHIDDLERDDWRWIYDEAKAEKVCRFIELLPHEKGAKQYQPFLLEDWQIWFVCSIFGWTDRASGLRRFREAVLMVSRKNGKSPLAAAIALYMAFFDGEKGAEVYCGAASEKQAHEVFRPATAMLNALPGLCAHGGIEVNAKSIVQPRSLSRFLPLIGKPGDGTMPHLAVIDEFHEHLDATLYDTMATGMVGRLQPLRLIISTAGETIAGPCHQKQIDVEQMLTGTIPNERLFGVIYCADDSVEWTSFEALQMANPNLGVSVQEEYLRETQAEAIRNSSKQNIFRCKHLGHWMTASRAWMNMDAFTKCADATLSIDAVKHLPCTLGIDIALLHDLSARAKVFRDDIAGKAHYYAFVTCYLHEAGIADPANQHFQRWEKEGKLTSTPGSSMDFNVLFADITTDKAAFKINEVAVDRMFAPQLCQDIEEQLGLTIAEIPQISKHLTPGMQELEAAVADGRFHYPASDKVLEWCIGNVISRELSSGLLATPDSTSEANKIDAAQAVFTAMARARFVQPKRTSFKPFFL
jgi:phage terminase large subunit-like protein